MKILFYAPSARYYRDLGVILDEACIYSHQGHDVYFIYNNCSFGGCTANMRSSEHICKICRMMMKKNLRLLPKSIKKLNINQFWMDNQHHFEYSSVDDIRKIQYKQVKVGYSVLSSYFTISRNLYPLIDESSRSFFDKLISIECNLTDALERAIDEIQPNKICFFNARYFDWRPPYDLAISKGIEAVSCELTNHPKQNSKEEYINSTPHNILYRQKRCNDIWNNSTLSIDEKTQIAELFFKNRRSGIVAGDKVYISKQKKGKLPDDYDRNKGNIVIFNSSEDEFAAIGTEYDALKLFRTQYQGISFILDTFKDKKDIHVYLRIHPNLSYVPYRYHTELLKLPELYHNVTVIPGDDSISTYDLMEAADKVIVFGSTMGLESAYWGRPVILLAGACYYYSDICYVPKSHEELKLLLLQKLRPKDNYETLKWGYYMMYRDPDMFYKYVDFDMEWFSIGKHKWLNVHYQKFLGSSKLYAILIKMITKIYRNIYPSSNDFPIQEDINAQI